MLLFVCLWFCSSRCLCSCLLFVGVLFCSVCVLFCVGVVVLVWCLVFLFCLCLCLCSVGVCVLVFVL